MYSELGYTSQTIGKISELSDLKAEIGEISQKMHKLRLTRKAENQACTDQHRKVIDQENKLRSMQRILKKAQQLDRSQERETSNPELADLHQRYDHLVLRKEEELLKFR